MPSPLSHRTVDLPSHRDGLGLLLSSSTTPESILLSARGEVDLVTAPLLERSLEAALATTGAVELDLHGVSFMDSQGLRAILLACDHPDGRTKVTVVNPSAQVRRVFDLAGVSELLGLP